MGKIYSLSFGEKIQINTNILMIVVTNLVIQHVVLENHRKIINFWAQKVWGTDQRVSVLPLMASDLSSMLRLCAWLGEGGGKCSQCLWSCSSWLPEGPALFGFQ